MTYEYYFLFVLAFAWIIFAVVQDLRTREISNWLNFSLIAFVLAYRAFYAVYSNDLSFFLYGLGGIAIFVGLGYLFYYSKIFAGGDAKLLFGLGGILPYKTLMDYVVLGGGFVFVLFLGGAVYTLIYSLFLVGGRFDSFKKDFRGRMLENKKWFYVTSIISVLLVIYFNFSWGVSSLSFLLLLGMPLLYVYTKSIEKVCMIKQVSPEKLTEGDWLERDVKVGNRLIKKSVHGLSMKNIKLLRKAKKKVWIKEGVPFSPAFLIAFIFTVVYVLF